MSTVKLTDLVGEAWSIFDSPEVNQLSRRPSMPILFFGNLKRYLHESNRVRTVTVGINPSASEFPRIDPFRRFGRSEGKELAKSRKSPTFSEEYVRILGEYFDYCPYDWFDNFSDFFDGFGCSFYDNARARALHTDLRSPVATASAWGDLSKSERMMLQQKGEPLWRKLVAYLRPRAVIFVVNPRPYYDTTKWKVIHSIREKKNGETRLKPYELRHFRDYAMSADFFYAQTVNVPFGSVSKEQKRVLGEEARRALAKI
jgi:hypothetical protein